MRAQHHEAHPAERAELALEHWDRRDHRGSRDIAAREPLAYTEIAPNDRVDLIADRPREGGTDERAWVLEITDEGERGVEEWSEGLSERERSVGST